MTDMPDLLMALLYVLVFLVIAVPSFLFGWFKGNTDTPVDVTALATARQASYANGLADGIVQGEAAADKRQKAKHRARGLKASETRKANAANPPTEDDPADLRSMAQKVADHGPSTDGYGYVVETPDA